jgi:hypothetical protein
MGEGLGGGAGAAAKSAAEKHTQAKGAGFLPMLHARSAFVNGPGLRDLHVGSCDWAGITPTQPSPIKGEGFRYPREGCVISFRRHDTSTRIALYRADGAMAGESKVDGSSSASLLAGCFSLFSLAVPGCYLPPAPVKKRGFLRPRPPSSLYFCGIYSDISDARALQRRRGQAGAKARLKAAQTRRCAFIASSTAGTMPKNAWIIPGNSLYSTRTPARCSASAYR